MQKRLLISLITGMLLLISACNAVGVPTNAVSSTPVDDLPVSVIADDAPVPGPTAVGQAIIAEADAENLLLSNIYERTTPSVVNIEADVLIDNGVSNSVDVSRGSGFIYDTQGHIITSAHVIKDARNIRVTFNDGFLVDAQLVGLDTFSDLGVLRVNVDLERLRPLNLVADSDVLRVGQRAIAIGNPFGLSSSMSVGIISGLRRTLNSAELIDAGAPSGFQNPSIIQVDTPINPGNSGGPLLNSQGHVMGVNTAIRTESGVFQGVGFAVPANTVRRVVPEVIQNGHVNYAWMGIFVSPEENGFGVAGLSDALNLPVDSGILVRGVTVNSPADKAGLQGGNEVVQVRGQNVCIGGDIIVAVNDVYVNNMDELVSYLVTHSKPGETVTLLVVRERETFEVPMMLEPRPTTETSVRDCAR